MNALNCASAPVSQKKAYQKQISKELEASTRRKRQRYATEQLYYLAQENNIELEDGIVAMPRRVRMDYGHGLINGEYSYVIFSKDRTKMLLWNMIEDEARILTDNPKNAFGKDIIVDDIATIVNFDKGLYGSVEMDAVFAPARWYVLEPLLVSGNLFDAQRKRTKLLQEFARREGLQCEDIYRAKLATVNGVSMWSLRCFREGKEVFAVSDMNSEYFDIAEDGVSLWVLQQRVGERKIHQFAKQNGWRIISEKPYLTTAPGYTAWTSFGISSAGEEGFVSCGVQQGDVVAEPYQLWDGANYSDLQKGNKPFDLEIGGLAFQAISWWEFLPVSKRNDDDDE